MESSPKSLKDSSNIIDILSPSLPRELIDNNAINWAIQLLNEITKISSEEYLLISGRLKLLANYCSKQEEFVENFKLVMDQKKIAAIIPVYMGKFFRHEEYEIEFLNGNAYEIICGPKYFVTVSPKLIGGEIGEEVVIWKDIFKEPIDQLSLPKFAWAVTKNSSVKTRIST